MKDERRGVSGYECFFCFLFFDVETDAVQTQTLEHRVHWYITKTMHPHLWNTNNRN